MDTVQPLLNGVQPLLNGLNIETSGNPRRKHEKAHTAARFHCYHFRLIELVWPHSGDRHFAIPIISNHALVF